MKKILLTKVILALLLLSSMVWSASYNIKVIQSCGGKLTWKKASWSSKDCNREFSVDPNTTGTTCTVLESNNTELTLETTSWGGHTFAGWTVVSGNCSFADASKASTTLKLKGDCVVKANRTFVNLLTLQASTGGSAIGNETLCGSEENSDYAKIFPAIEWYGFYDPKYTVNVSATPNNSYRFDKWTITSGSGNCTIEDKNSKNTSVGINGECTVKANFIQTGVLTVNASTGGTASPIGSKTVDVGTRVKITAIPDETHVFTSWNKATNCPVDDNRSATTYVTVNGDCTIKPAFVKFYELTIAAGTGGTTTETTKRTYSSGSAEVSVAATPKSGYRFDKWVKVSGGGACYVIDEAAATTNVHVRETCKIQATFVRTYEVKLSAGSVGSTNFTSETVDAGSKVEISVYPSQYGYRFDKWTSSSTSCIVADPASSSTTVTVNGACTVTASFVQRNTFAIGPNIAEAGTTSPYGYQTVDKGSSNSIKATPKSGYRFDRWGSSSASSCLIANAASASTTVKVSGDCNITANFVKLQDVNVYAGTGGTTSPSGYLSVDSGATFLVSATPSSGYRFKKWVSTSTSCVVLNETKASTYVKASADCNITAHFIKTYSLNVYMATYDGTSLYKYPLVDEGSSYQLEINPNITNYDFDKWVFVDSTTLDEISVSESVCKIENPTSPTAAKVVVNGPCSVEAKLRLRTIVNVVAEEGGTVTPSGEMQGHAEEYMNISAMPNESYRFLQWVNSANCRIEDRYNANTRVLPLSTVGCTVTAKFRKQARIVIDSVENIDIKPRDEYIDVGRVINIYPYSSDRDWQLSHFEYISGEQNCPVSMENTGVFITINGDCEIKPVVVPYFELTENFKTYYHFYNGERSSSRVRFHAATEDSAWYYVEFSSPADYEGSMYNFGTDAWKGNAVDSCIGTMDGLGCYFKSSGEDNYVTVGQQNYLRGPFSVKYSKVSTDYVDVEYDLAGKMIQGPTIDVGHGMDTLIEAESLTGYVFKEWKLIDGDCEVDSSSNQRAHVKLNSSRCRYHGVYEADPEANVGIGLIGTGYNNSVQCNYISVADSTKPQTFFAWRPKQISHVRLSDITLTFDGDTLQLYTVGDTIWVPIVNEALREYHGADSLPVVVEQPWEPFYMGLLVCEVLPDVILNGDEHTIAVYTDYAGETLSWEYSGPESVIHDPDAPEIIKLRDTGAGSDSIVRTTEKMKIEVQTQDFSDDIWGYDYYVIDMPMTILSTLPVKVSCLSSEDEETLDLTHVDGGVYSISDFAKNEGKAVKGDSVLTCAADDMIVTEFVDPLYKTVTRDTVVFGDVVPVEYVFLEADLVRDIDSVETTEVDFAFSLNTVSPTYDKVDTIIVALFTDLGDTLWVPAFETDVYSGVFEGHGSFRFVTSPEDQKDDVLDAAMDLDADANRAVIRMQIGKDKSALDSRDSIVVFYEFIPAISAEIQDLDLDGRADFARVHFAKSILQEQLKIDTLFWGGAEDDGRGVTDRDMEISDEGDWIYIALDNPFEYGVTAVDSTGKKFVSISRNTSSAIQKVKLSDKMGPVPVRAKKLPGAIGDEEYLNGKVAIPPDTLVVTLSEPVEFKSGAKAFSKNRSNWSKIFQFAETCDNGKAHPISLDEEPELDESGTVWTLVLPHEVDVRVGHCLMTNPDASIQDVAGNAPAIGGVSVEGDDGEIYLYSIKGDPAIAEDTVSAISVETRMDYKADVTIFDHIGHAVAQFDKKNDEGTGHIEWNQRTFENRLVGTGVYIWKIRFVFADGHKETRFIRTGIRRR